jgi:hypothetical protein
MKMNRERNGYSVLFECDRESVEWRERETVIRLWAPSVLSFVFQLHYLIVLTLIRSILENPLYGDSIPSFI